MMRWLGLSILAALASMACGQSRLQDNFDTEQATRLRIEPESFRGNVPCARGVAGALQFYAVTFHRVPAGMDQSDAGLFQQTSTLVPCDRAVLLDAVPNWLYVADLYGFDRGVSGAGASLADARWTATCGRGESNEPPESGRGGPTLALYGLVATVAGCSKFSQEEVPGGTTRLVIDQAGALGTLTCGTGPGQVSRLEGVLQGARVSAACGTPLVFDVARVARDYSIDLIGYEASPGSRPASSGDLLDASVPSAALGDAAADAASGLDAGALDAGSGGGGTGDSGPSDAGIGPGIARWRSQCSGRAVPGTAAVAACQPLAPLPSGG